MMQPPTHDATTDSDCCITECCQGTCCLVLILVTLLGIAAWPWSGIVFAFSIWVAVLWASPPRPDKPILAFFLLGLLMSAPVVWAVFMGHSMTEMVRDSYASLSRSFIVQPHNLVPLNCLSASQFSYETDCVRARACVHACWRM